LIHVLEGTLLWECGEVLQAEALAGVNAQPGARHCSGFRS